MSPFAHCTLTIVGPAVLAACSAAGGSAPDDTECAVACQEPLSEYTGLDSARTLAENDAACSDEDTGTECWATAPCGAGTVLTGPESQVGSHHLENYYDADGNLVAVAFFGDVVGVCIEDGVLNTLWGDVPECWEECLP